MSNHYKVGSWSDAVKVLDIFLNEETKKIDCVNLNLFDTLDLVWRYKKNKVKCVLIWHIF